MEETDNLNTDLVSGLLSDEVEEEDVFGQYDIYQFNDNLEEESNDEIPDETADYIFMDSKCKKSNPPKNLQPVETKLENETSQRGYYKVCKEIESKIPNYYNDKVVKTFTFLLDNQKIVNKEYGTKEDQPDGEWMINVEDADEETLAKEINRLKIKLQNVHNENKSLEKKRQNIQTRLDNAIDENERLQNELDQ